MGILNLINIFFYFYLIITQFRLSRQYIESFHCRRLNFFLDNRYDIVCNRDVKFYFNRFKRIPLLMIQEMFNILQQDDFRSLRLDNLEDVIYKGTTRILKSFHFPRYTERLARETRSKNIVLGNKFQRNFGNISKRIFTIISMIHTLGVRIEF